MNHHQENVWEAIAKAAAWVAAWFGTVQLADVQVGVSIISGLAVGGLALRNLWLSFKKP